MIQYNNSAGFEGYCKEILTKREQSLKFFSMAADMQNIGNKNKKGQSLWE